MVVAVTLGLALAAWFSSRLLRIVTCGALAATLAEVDLFSPRERYTDANGIVFPVAALVALMRYPDRILLPALAGDAVRVRGHARRAGPQLAGSCGCFSG